MKRKNSTPVKKKLTQQRVEIAYSLARFLFGGHYTEEPPKTPQEIDEYVETLKTKLKNYEKANKNE